jgi:hypothetical protein
MFLLGVIQTYKKILENHTGRGLGLEVGGWRFSNIQLFFIGMDFSSVPVNTTNGLKK